MKKPEDSERKNPYRVPPLYFDDIADRVMERIVTEPGFQTERRSLFAIIRPHITLAAAMIVLAIVSWWGLRLLLPDSDNNLQERQSHLTTYLVSEVDMQTLLSESESVELTGFGDPADSEEIIEYLILNDIDYTTITEEY
ncbi:MAG: hypothetical protein ABR519_10290 [Bacteroidales bacterium]